MNDAATAALGPINASRSKPISYPILYRLALVSFSRVIIG